MKMAYIWMKQCKKYELDPCTALHKTEEAYTQVTQSSSFVLKKYLPKHYESSCIQKWYFERARMRSPHWEGNYAYLNDFNNFTPIVWADTSRIGCAVGRFSNGYRVTCNYYPFLGLNFAAFIRGGKCNDCSPTAPLCSGQFENLCASFGSSPFEPKTGTTIYIVFGILILALILIILFFWPILYFKNK